MGDPVAPTELAVERLQRAEQFRAADEFAAEHEKKDYQAHVRMGHRNGEEVTQAIPYGEDRDGDGEADTKPGKGGGGGKGKGKGK